MPKVSKTNITRYPRIKDVNMKYLGDVQTYNNKLKRQLKKLPFDTSRKALILETAMLNTISRISPLIKKENIYVPNISYKEYRKLRESGKCEAYFGSLLNFCYNPKYRSLSLGLVFYDSGQKIDTQLDGGVRKLLKDDMIDDNAIISFVTSVGFYKKGETKKGYHKYCFDKCKKLFRSYGYEPTLVSKHIYGITKRNFFHCYRIKKIA